MLNSHRAVVGSKYFYITNLFVPFAFIVIGTLYREAIGTVTPGVFLFVQVWLMMYEVSTEYFGYGAIYRKNNFGMEYLKTSVNGMDLVKKSMLTDSILRIIRTVIYTVLPGILVLKSVDNMKVLIISAFVLANVSVWSVSFTRYVTMYGFLIMISTPLVTVGIIIDDLICKMPHIHIPTIIILSILLIGGVIFTQFFASKKIKASYSDLA